MRMSENDQTVYYVSFWRLLRHNFPNLGGPQCHREKIGKMQRGLFEPNLGRQIDLRVDVVAQS